MAHYRFSPHHLSTIHHGHQGRIANPRLSGDIKITVCECNTIYSVLVLLFVRPLKRGELLQQGLVCLKVACSCMKTQNTHENVLVVGQNCDSLDILDMRMLAK